MTRPALLLLLCVALPALCLTAPIPARAAIVTSPRAEQVTLTIYHVGDHGDRETGLAEVTETRDLDLPAGANQIRFRGVAATLIPQTAKIAGLPGVEEQNFDFSLLSPGSLLEKSVGRTVHLVREARNGETDQAATLRSGPDGAVLETAGGIETLGCSGAPERLVFGSLPETLFDVPTLSVATTVPRAGRYRLTLRYLATGLTWAANYVARINPGGRTLTLSGWITLANEGESGFGDAPVQVVAGTPNHDEEKDVPPALKTVPRQAGCWPTAIDWASHMPSEAVRQRLGGLGGSGGVMGFAAAAPADDIQTVNSSAGRIGEPFNLGDYKLYALAEPTTVAAKQTKQLQFLNQPRVPFRQVFRISGGFDDRDRSEKPASIMLRTSNTKAGGLGKPLPAGRITMLGPESGVTVLLGEMTLRDTPAGLPLEIVGNPYGFTSGQTMAVSAHSVQLKSEHGKTEKYSYQRDTIEVTATNHKAVPADFEWCQGTNWGDGMRLLAEDRKHEQRNGCWVWPIRLKPGEQTSFRYTVEVDDD